MKQKFDVCPECMVRDNDSRKKTLYQCSYCERWFCFRHLDQKLAVFKDFKRPVKDKRLQDMIEEDWKRRDGHPDFQYTLDRLKEYEIEKLIDRKIITDLLNRSKAYGKRKPKPKKRMKEGELFFVKEDATRKEETKPKPNGTPKEHMKEEGEFHFAKEAKTETRRELSGKEQARKRHLSISVRGLVWYSIVFIAGLFLFLYSARNVYLIFIVPFIPFPVPVWIFGIAIMIVGAMGLFSSLR